jgi:hypothetical protein
LDDTLALTRHWAMWNTIPRVKRVLAYLGLLARLPKIPLSDGVASI